MAHRLPHDFPESLKTPAPIAISVEKIAEVARKYAIGNPRLDALQGFVNEIILVNGAEYAADSQDELTHCPQCRTALQYIECSHCGFDTSRATVRKHHESGVHTGEKDILIDLLCGQLSAAVYFTNSKEFNKSEALALIEKARAILESSK
jgi:hypothetical protein